MRRGPAGQRGGRARCSRLTFNPELRAGRRLSRFLLVARLAGFVLIQKKLHLGRLRIVGGELDEAAVVLRPELGLPQLAYVDPSTMWHLANDGSTLRHWFKVFAASVNWPLR